MAEGTAETTEGLDEDELRMRGMNRMTNLTKRQKEMALVVLSVILFISLSAYSYFLVYAPAKETNDQVKLTTSNERDVLFALLKQSASQARRIP